MDSSKTPTATITLDRDERSWDFTIASADIPNLDGLNGTCRSLAAGLRSADRIPASLLPDLPRTFYVSFFVRLPSGIDLKAVSMARAGRGLMLQGDAEWGHFAPEAVRGLSDAGLSLRDIAAVLHTNLSAVAEIVEELDAGIDPGHSGPDYRPDIWQGLRGGSEATVKIHTARCTVLPPEMSGNEWLLIQDDDYAMPVAEPERIDLSERIGPRVGNVYIPGAPDTGIAVTGEPGTGKTELMSHLFGWSWMERNEPTKLTNWTGANRSLIALTNGRGATERYARFLGMFDRDEPWVIRCANPADDAIDIFHSRAPRLEHARQLADVIADVVRLDTDQTALLVRLLHGAITYADVRPGPASPFHWVQTFSAWPQRDPSVPWGRRCADIVDLRRRLSEQRGSMPDEVTATERLGAIDDLAMLFLGTDIKADRDRFNDLHQKLFPFFAAEPFWTYERDRSTWDVILDTRSSIVIDTEMFKPGEDTVTDGYRSHLVSSVLVGTLYSTIRRHTAAGTEPPRPTTVFVDNLNLLGGSGDELLGWMHEHGAEARVRPVYGAGYVEQLSPTVQAMMDAMPTRIHTDARYDTRRKEPIYTATVEVDGAGPDCRCFTDVPLVEADWKSLRAHHGREADIGSGTIAGRVSP